MVTFNMDMGVISADKTFNMDMGVISATSGGTGDYNDLTNKPKINDVELKGNKTSEELKLYGENNEPPYPVKSVNGMTGDVIVPTGGGAVNSVNGQTGDVVLTAKDVNALPDTTIIPTELSQLDNDVGYITNTALSGYAKESDIPTKTSELVNDSNYITNTALEPYAKKSEIPAVPTKTSQLDNDSGFITSADVPTKLSELDNDENFITSVALNDYAKTADVVEKTDITQMLDNSTDKVPSAKAVSDAITSAGGGDMMKAVYDPNSTVADAGGIVNYVNVNGGKIDTVKVNNVTQEITDKTVNITVPTDNADLVNGANYITSAQAPVQSVNGQTGNVNIIIPDEPTKLSELENDTGFITDKALDGYAKSNEIPTNNNQLTNGAGYITSDALTPYAKSVDLPTKTSELTNDSGYITSADIPVASVNAKTGEVVLNATDVGALPDTTKIPSVTSDLTNDSGYITESVLTPYAKTADIPEYNIVKAETAQDGYFATYYLSKDGVNLSTGINIPKDYLVKSADIKTSTGDTDPSGLPEGTKYIDFVVNTYVGSGTENHIYLNVNELVDAYTAGDGIEISENNVISAKVVSVNSKVGNVNLTYSDVGALSADTVIPSVNNGKLTVQRNGVDVAEFTANNSTDVVANITVPTYTSELTNDSNYITASGAPIQSVNNKTGAVNLTAEDVGALPDTTVIPNDVVKYTAQTLTDIQRQQARDNIGAGTQQEYSSTDEIAIGKWIDGRTIYRKTIVWTENPLPANKWAYYQEPDLLALNIDQYTNLSGLAFCYSQSTTSGSWQPIPRVCPDALTQYSIGFGDLNAGSLGVLFGTSYTGATIYFTIEYVKKTS